MLVLIFLPVLAIASSHQKFQLQMRPMHWLPYPSPDFLRHQGILYPDEANRFRDDNVSTKQLTIRQPTQPLPVHKNILPFEEFSGILKNVILKIRVSAVIRKVD